MSAVQAGTIGYVLKGYPRLSETFIASEIYRLEQAGLPLRLTVIKPPEAHETSAPHPVVDRTQAAPHYLPGTTSLGVPLVTWLRRNLAGFRRPLVGATRRHPLRTARAGLAGFAQAIRARKHWWSKPRKVYLKEFFQAAALADHLASHPEVRHLHAHFAHGATTVTWLASMMTGLPFSFTAHARDIYSASLNPAGLLPRKLRAARFVLTCTEENRRYLEPMAGGTPVHRVYHGLNADLARMLAAAGPAPARPSDALHILAVGRLVVKKGFDTLVEACALLRSRGVPFRASIVGQDGDLGDTVRATIRRLDLGVSVEVVGPMTQAQLLERYRRANVFALPCRVLDDVDRDGIPNVLVEAMACETPVVSTTVSGIPELVDDGRNGLLVPPDDPEALADALERVHRDAELARKLAQLGRETVEQRFDGEKLAAGLVELFRREVPA